MPADLVLDQAEPPHHQASSPASGDDEAAAYYPIGALLDLVTSRGRRIPRAEVLFHDPVYQVVVVRYPAASGAPDRHDVAYLQLRHARQVQLAAAAVSTSSLAGLEQEELDLDGVRARLQRSLAALRPAAATD